MNKKFISIILCLLIIGAVVFRFYLTVPKELEKITSPDGKITATISEKSGNLLVESNRTNPLTIDFDHDIEYGMSAFSSDSRYLFVAIEKKGRGDIECRDFVENKSFSIHLQSIIRTSDKFTILVDEYDITEINDATVTVIDINEHSRANLSYSFNDQNGKKHSLMVSVDLYNQKVELVK